MRERGPASPGYLPASCTGNKEALTHNRSTGARTGACSLVSEDGLPGHAGREEGPRHLEPHDLPAPGCPVHGSDQMVAYALPAVGMRRRSSGMPKMVGVA